MHGSRGCCGNAFPKGMHIDLIIRSRRAKVSLHLPVPGLERERERELTACLICYLSMHPNVSDLFMIKLSIKSSKISKFMKYISQIGLHLMKICRSCSSRDRCKCTSFVHRWVLPLKLKLTTFSYIVISMPIYKQGGGWSGQALQAAQPKDKFMQLCRWRTVQKD